ncbi:MAG: copper chaperone [Acholeplasmatales bacterium]|nr:MAG: copper chaperone [Acholeplasmatales bacterium]
MNIQIENIHCGSCINPINRVLKPLGATKIVINLSRRFGRIMFEEEAILAEVFIEAIETAAYKALSHRHAFMMRSDRLLLQTVDKRVNSKSQCEQAVINVHPMSRT